MKKIFMPVWGYIVLGFASVLLIATIFFVCIPGTKFVVSNDNEVNIPLNTEVTESRKNELVFKFSIGGFIYRYNSYYKEENESTYLTPYSEWRLETLECGIHSPYKTNIYTFTEDEKAWSLPTISVYTPSENESVQEIAVNYDWHSHSDSIYSIYEKMCYYTLKCVLPELSDDGIVELYTNANAIGYDNMRSVDEWYSKDSVPAVLYYKDGVGVYPYFAIGSAQHLCIIPINENTLGDFKNKGVEIYEIKQ